MCHDIEHPMKIVVCLRLDRLYDFRLGISDIQYADTADPVQKFISVQILDHRALTACDRYRIRASDRAGCRCLSSVDQCLCLRAGHRLCNNLR